METKIKGKFLIQRKIGSGSFGDIFLGKSIESKEEVAIKLEQTKTKVPQLIWESKVLLALAGGVGIPTVHWCGKDGEYNCMAMTLLGQSLDEMFTMCDSKFSVRTVLMLADQIISRLEFLHAKNFIYRDIKPENFMMGASEADADTVYLIDFGLAKRFRDAKSGNHFPYKENKPFVGTVRYASLNTHLGREQSRRDDLEAIGYMLVYFLRGSLPWIGVQALNKKEKFERIKSIKINTDLNDLCADEFAEFIKYARGLTFEEKPDYNLIKGQFRAAFTRLGFTMDFKFDWTKRIAMQKNQSDFNSTITNKQDIDELVADANQNKQDEKEAEEERKSQ